MGTVFEKGWKTPALDLWTFETCGTYFQFLLWNIQFLVLKFQLVLLFMY